MKKLLLYGLSFLALIACNPAGLDPSGPEDRVLVGVELSLDIAPVEAGMPATKTDWEPDDPDYDAALAVKSVAILQFEWVDGMAANAKLIYQFFAPDWASAKPTLATSTQKNTLVVVANVPGKLPVVDGTTYGDFLEKMNYSLLDGLEDRTGYGVWYLDQGSGDRYLRMSGAKELDPPMTQGGIGSVTLRRNCAKVVIKVRNDAPSEDKLVIDAVQLREVNRKYYYLAGGGWKDDYSDITPFRFDEPEVLYAPVPYEADGKTKTFSFLVPANLRGVSPLIGTDDTQENHSRKSLQPLPGATCFSIFARYGCTDAADPENGTPVVYTYYLGANLTNDFNLAPNKIYRYSLFLPGKGSDSDGRVDDLKAVVLPDANAYMLHPPKGEGQVRKYSFPVRRAAVFWNQGPNPARDITVGYYAGSDEEEYRLTEHSQWTAEIVWNDVFIEGRRVSNDELLVTAEGTGFDPDHAGSQPYITVKVAKGMYGNALVGVRKVAASGDKSYGDLLWSWHLWVTDYDPDVPVAKQDGTFIYPVPGGEVHRYNGTVWNTTYAEAFAMDRNMGALAPVWGVGDYDSHGAYYQQGRKDPMYANGIAGHNSQQYASKDNYNSSPGSIRYTIHHPTIYLRMDSGAPWMGSGDGDVGDKSKPWNDPRINDSARPADWVETGKSIYDPCPPGWQVPTSQTYVDFATGGTGANRHRAWDSELYGAWYYPEGYPNQETAGAIFFPAAGHIIWNGGTYRFTQTAVNLYMENGSSEIRETSLAANSNSANMNTSAQSVRCVKKHQ